MDDKRLALALVAVRGLEEAAKVYLAQLPPTADAGERAAAQVAARQATALRKPLESWIATRTLRAHT